MSRRIPLTKGQFALVSDSDYPLLSQFTWHYAHGYAARSVRVDGRCSVEYMHRVICTAADDQIVDHRDGNGLNNTRENLRLVTRAENQWNRGPTRNSSTRYKGVGRYGARYQVRIRVYGRQIHLGYWDDLQEAALMYDTAARHFHGDFAYLNFPDALPREDLERALHQRLHQTETGQPRTVHLSVVGPSRYRGVYRERGKWRAKITVDGNSKHLGYFNSEQDAAMAYDNAARLYRGHRAILNLADADD